MRKASIPWHGCICARGGGDSQQIGGSHAQRDIFARITIEAALRGGYMDAAETLLRDRTRQRAQIADGYTERRLDLIHAARSRAV